MSAQITLTRYTAAPNALPLSEQQVWPITIEATAVGISPHIFVYRAHQHGDPFGGDAFSCVASVNQLYELPRDRADVINDTFQIPFYRSCKLELFCRSQAEADYIWTVVNEDVQNLITNFNLSFALQGTVTNNVTSDTITALPPTTMKPPTRIQLDYHPAGTATLTGNVQGITNPNPALTGWLPAASAPTWYTVPVNAAFFYNIALDTVLQAFWPLSQPWSGNELYRNGILLPYGVTHVFTADTIWWLNFDPTTLPGYVRSGSVQDENAPWPADYVDLNNPGAVSPNITLIAYS